MMTALYLNRVPICAELCGKYQEKNTCKCGW